MKQLKYIVPLMVLAGVFIAVTGCNQAGDTAALPAISNPSANFVAAIDVVIDIVPHKPSNQINCGAKNRLIAVAILTTDDFDAMTVDPASVEFEGAYDAHEAPSAVDVEGDGDLDLVFHFLYKETDLTCESTEGCLSGYTDIGIPIYGCDFVDMFSK